MKIDESILRRTASECALRGLRGLTPLICQEYLKNKILLWLFCICFPTLSFADSNIQVIVSGAQVNTNSTVGWLNNKEIVFQGYEKTSNTYSLNISIWRVGDKVEIYKKNVNYLCFMNENIYFVVKDPISNKLEHFFGAFGKESQIDSPKIYQGTCQSYADINNTAHFIWPLLPQHGYLDMGPKIGLQSYENSPIRFYRNSDSKTIELPLKRREVEGGVRYFSFKNAYLVTSEFFDPVKKVSFSPWPSGIDRPLWWLTPTGKVSQFAISPPWNRSTQFFPFRDGIVVAGFDWRLKNPKLTDIGLFLIQPTGKVRKIIDGDVRNIATSPDGCSIAFSHVDIPNTVSATLEVVNLCNQQN